jgi:hypothetical protein
MSLTLDAITLPDDLIWTDEFDWTPIQQTQSYTLTGALVLESGEKQAGRPITLVGGDNAAWATRAQIDALYAKLTGDPVMTLTLHDARVFSVKWVHEKPIDAKLILDYNNPISSDWYSLTIKLIAI